MNAVHDDNKSSNEGLVDMGAYHNSEGVLVEQHIADRKLPFDLSYKLVLVEDLSLTFKEVAFDFKIRGFIVVVPLEEDFQMGLELHHGGLLHREDEVVVIEVPAQAHLPPLMHAPQLLPGDQNGIAIGVLKGALVTDTERMPIHLEQNIAIRVSDVEALTTQAQRLLRYSEFNRGGGLVVLCNDMEMHDA